MKSIFCCPQYRDEVVGHGSKVGGVSFKQFHCDAAQLYLGVCCKQRCFRIVFHRWSSLPGQGSHQCRSAVSIATKVRRLKHNVYVLRLGPAVLLLLCRVCVTTCNYLHLLEPSPWLHQSRSAIPQSSCWKG